MPDRTTGGTTRRARLKQSKLGRWWFFTQEALAIGWQWVTGQ